MPSEAPIEHVVVLMMENAAFDRMLGCMTEVHPDLEGVDPAHPQHQSGSRRRRRWRRRRPRRATSTAIPKHYLPNGLAQLAGGTNSGFVTDFARTHPTSTAAERREIMAYYPRGFLPALHMLAEQFVVCDHWFSSLPGPTWINRLFAHTGTSLGPCQRAGQPVQQQAASLRRAHAVRRAARCRRAVADLFRRRAAIAGADASARASGQLSPVRALARRRRQAAICRPTPSSSRPISARTRTTSIRRTTCCAATR